MVNWKHGIVLVSLLMLPGCAAAPFIAAATVGGGTLYGANEAGDEIQEWVVKARQMNCAELRAEYAEVKKEDTTAGRLNPLNTVSEKKGILAELMLGKKCTLPSELRK